MSDETIKTFNVSIFDRVLESGSVDEKKNLTKQLGLLACDTSEPIMERQAIVPAMLRLAGDPVKEIRALLASILTHCEELHADVLFSIIADDEEISLPFLAACPALDQRRFLVVLEVGDKSRQMVVASRSDLSRDAVSYIADRCESDVCIELLDNDDIEVSVKDYRRLYIRFRDNPEVMERLLARDDLPLEVRILQAKKASSNVHKLMTERGWVASHDAQDIIIDAEETTMLRILSSADEAEIDGLISFLASKKLLTPSIILRAACAGDIRMVSRALSYLSSTPLRRVQKIIDDGATMALKGIYNRSGLPKNCFHIIRAAVDVAVDMSHLPAGAKRTRFGSAVIECLMTKYNSISPQQKSTLLEIVARMSDDGTRNLARRLATQLQAA